MYMNLMLRFSLQNLLMQSNIREISLFILNCWRASSILKASMLVITYELLIRNNNMVTCHMDATHLSDGQQSTPDSAVWYNISFYGVV